jgi:hypothetical protein
MGDITLANLHCPKERVDTKNMSQYQNIFVVRKMLGCNVNYS